MEIITYIQMDTMLILVLLLIVFHVNKSKYAPKKDEQRLYNIHLCSIILSVAIEAVSAFVDGRQFFNGTHTVDHVVNTLGYLTNPLPMITWLMYVRKKLGYTTKNLRLSKFLFIAPLLVNTILSLTNYYTNWYFIIDESGFYRRSYGYLSAYLIVLIYALWVVALTVKAGRQPGLSKDKRRHVHLLLVYLISPSVGIVIQCFFYGIPSVWMSSTLAVCIYYINDTLYRLERMHQLEKELDDSRVTVMLSQIRPHFLYNALVAIQELCYTDAELAAEAVGEFATYLRSNLDALTQQSMIPFQKEMQHVNNYLSLEKKRFEERLNVTYNLAVDEFDLPVMTLQPIVENAVRHGVTKRESGGTVDIATEETPDAIRIIVSDDGVGIDVSRTPQDGRSHVGVESVKNRLENICGGTLHITSQLGVGTTVTITIPKKRREQNI